MLEAVATRILQTVFGSGANISGANPLPVDTSPGAKTVTTVLTDAVLAAATTTVIGDCANIDISAGAGSLALTIGCTFNAAATQGISVHFRSSYDGVNWDTIDYYTWIPTFTAGAAIIATIGMETDVYYLRALIENLDAAQTLTLITLNSTLGA